MMQQHLASITGNDGDRSRVAYVASLPLWCRKFSGSLEWILLLTYIRSIKQDTDGNSELPYT